MTRVTLDDLRKRKAAGQKFAMLTAYDFPTASAAERAGVPTLLVGDSAASVVLGRDTTRDISLNLLVTLAEAVRRGAPNVYLVGDLPHETMGSTETIVAGARRYVDEARCDAVKLEAEGEHLSVIEQLRAAEIDAIAHLGLRPQSVASPEGYRAQARTPDDIAVLVELARRMEAAGAAMLLLEAVPPEASAAVAETVAIPIIGCGAGPACDGFVVVTHDMLGLTTGKPPRFVPVHERLAERMTDAMLTWREAVESGAYPQPQHNYPMRSSR